MNVFWMKELLLQSLEHERAGVKIYAAALECVQNDELEEEWSKHFEESGDNVENLTDVCQAMGIDPEERSSGRAVVRGLGEALVLAMKAALGAGDRDEAELLACECVAFAAAKDHLDWELLADFARRYSGDGALELKLAVDEVERQEAARIHDPKSWCRELWRKALGFDPLLPPAEKRRKVITLAQARRERARAKLFSRDWGVRPK